MIRQRLASFCVPLHRVVFALKQCVLSRVKSSSKSRAVYIRKARARKVCFLAGLLLIVRKNCLYQAFRIMASKLIVLQIEVFDQNIGNETCELCAINFYRLAFFLCISLHQFWREWAIVDNYAIYTPS